MRTLAMSSGPKAPPGVLAALEDIEVVADDDSAAEAALDLSQEFVFCAAEEQGVVDDQ